MYYQNLKTQTMQRFAIMSTSCLMLSLHGCTEPKENRVQLEVTVTAYTSHQSQTDKTPYLAAWNNVLKPEVKSIAVSRDLLKMGLKNGSKVKIEGLEGEYLVLDKMNKRWQKKIDIYMGTDFKKAKQWGKQTLKISWVKPKDEAAQ